MGMNTSVTRAVPSNSLLPTSTAGSLALGLQRAASLAMRHFMPSAIARPKHCASFRLHRVLVLTFAASMLAAAGCARNPTVAAAEELTGGRATEGRHLIYSYGCGSCHIIPGVNEATGTVGPPLRGFADRNYIAGLLVNTPPNLFRWIKEPQKVDPRTAMPSLGVTENQAHDMGAYLYTLH